MTRDHFKEIKERFTGGATATHVDERFDLICPAALRRLAARYALGAYKHGDSNWCKGAGDPVYFKARLNHVLKHLNLYLLEGNAKDDNLAAAAWGLFALMHFEEGCQHHSHNESDATQDLRDENSHLRMLVAEQVEL